MNKNSSFKKKSPLTPPFDFHITWISFYTWRPFDTNSRAGIDRHFPKKLRLSLGKFRKNSVWVFKKSSEKLRAVLVHWGKTPCSFSTLRKNSVWVLVHWGQTLFEFGKSQEKLRLSLSKARKTPFEFQKVRKGFKITPFEFIFVGGKETSFV